MKAKMKKSRWLGWLLATVMALGMVQAYAAFDEDDVEWTGEWGYAMARCEDCGEEYEVGPVANKEEAWSELEKYFCSSCGKCGGEGNDGCWLRSHCALCNDCVDDYCQECFDEHQLAVCESCIESSLYRVTHCPFCGEHYPGGKECDCEMAMVDAHCSSCHDEECRLCGGAMSVHGSETPFAESPGCFEHEICQYCIIGANDPEHCRSCYTCDEYVCEECGLCESCAEDEEHCPECGHCFGDGGIEWCEHGGDYSHCTNCCKENEWLCGWCGECIEGRNMDVCNDCGFCEECCVERAEADGCGHGYCIESSEFEDHLCPNCQQCPEDSECEYCGLCEDCQENEHCEHGICPEGDEWESHLCEGCGDCFEADDLCEYCGLCENCWEHCEHDRCPEEGSFEDDLDHFICDQCGECHDGNERCDDCELCVDCSNANIEAKGCEHGLCIESSEFADHWCYEDDQCLELCNHNAGCEHQHVTTTWNSDGQAHWNVCDDCGVSVNKAVHTEGSLVTIVDPDPLTKKNGVGSISCTVCSHDMGTVTIPYVEIPTDGKPYILTQPKDYTGKTTEAYGTGIYRYATFQVKAGGEGLTYQWYRSSGTPLKEQANFYEGTQTATLKVLVMTDDCLEDGTHSKYYCVVSNSKGSVQSRTTEVKAQHVFGHYLYKDADTHDYYCLGECSTIKKTSKHRFGEWTLVKPATELEMGERNQKCMDCGYSNKVYIPKVEPGHVHAYVMKYDGKNHWRACKCGLPDPEYTAEAHNFDKEEVISEPTEKKMGENKKTCTTCGFSKTVKVDKIPHTHDWYLFTILSNNKPDPDKCGRSSVQHFVRCKGENCDQIKADEHVWLEWVCVKAPTADSEGRMRRQCEICFQYDYMWFENGTYPVMVRNGITSHPSAKPGTVVTITYDRNTSQLFDNEKFKEWRDESGSVQDIYWGPPNTIAVKSVNFADKNKETTTFVMPDGPVAIIASTVKCDHTNGTYEGKQTNPTCKGYGHKPHTLCVDCDKVMVEGERIPALGHDLLDEPVYGTEVLEYCTLADGSPNPNKSYSGDFECGRCGETVKGKKRGQEHGKKGSSLSWDQIYEYRNKVDVTCEKDGYTGDLYCKLCDTRVEKSMKKPRTGHKWGEWTPLVVATTKVKGVEQHVCEYDDSHVETRVTDYSGPDYTLKADKTKLRFEFTYGDTEIAPQTVTFRSTGRDAVTALNSAATSIDGMATLQPSGLALSIAPSVEDVLGKLSSGKCEFTVSLAGVTTDKGATTSFTAPQITVQVTMKKAELSLAFAEAEMTAYIGKPAASPDITGCKDALTYEWKSSDNSVATIDPSAGVVNPLGAGTTTITASFAGNEFYKPTKVTYTLTVEKNDPAIGYNEPEVDGKHGEDFTAQTLTNPNGLTVVYSSSDDKVATVDPTTGEVTLQGEGDVTITATFEGNAKFLPGAASYVIHVERHDGVPVIEEFFPDEKFRQFVEDSGYDLDGDGWLEDFEIEVVTTMDVSKLGIADLTGIEHFTALKELDCHGNKIASLDVSTLTDLEMLFCYENELTELDVTMLSKLKGLYCFTNQIPELDVSQNPLLQYFYCYNNLLTDIDVTENPFLTHLDVSQNGLTSLDVSQNTKLELLSCYMNHLSGTAMDALIASLPQRIGDGQLRALAPSVEGEADENEVTKEQVAAARKRGWTMYYWPGTMLPKESDDWLEYTGSEATGIRSVGFGDVSDDSWYSLDGKKLNAEPKKKGVYIIKGKKVKR